jgi:hypothetical protein
MADTVAVFHSSHGNLATVTGAPSISTIGDGVAGMRKQKSVDGQFLNLVPQYIVTPVALEVATRQVLSPVNAAQVSNSNAPITNLGLELVVDPRLDVASATGWYLFSNPSNGSGLTIAFLDELGGAPEVTTRDGWAIDGLEVKCKHIAAVAWTGHVGAWANAG